jgi:hypothetical protein
MSRKKTSPRPRRDAGVVTYIRPCLVLGRVIGSAALACRRLQRRCQPQWLVPIRRFLTRVQIFAEGLINCAPTRATSVVRFLRGRPARNIPVRSNSASLRASTLSLLLPSFYKALRRGLHTRTCCTCGCSRSYSHAAQVPSSRSHAARPADREGTAECCWLWFPGWFPMTSFPQPFRTAIYP